jgi:hypothetical protein
MLAIGTTCRHTSRVMKKLPLILTFFVVILVGLVFVSTLRSIASEKRLGDERRAFDICITDPVTVGSPEKLRQWLDDHVGGANYKLRIKTDGQPDKVYGDLEECAPQKIAASSEPSQKNAGDPEPSASPSPSSTPGGGAQVTQHLRLRTEELGELGSALEETGTPTPTPSG